MDTACLKRAYAARITEMHSEWADALAPVDQ